MASTLLGSPALEAINFQHTSPLFHDLTVQIEKIRGRTDVIKAARESKKDIEKIISKNTGFAAVFDVVNDPTLNASVILDIMDRNNPLLNDYQRHVMTNSLSIKKVKAQGGILKGEVDREKAKVSGVFSDIEVKIKVNRGLLTNDTFTNEEVAATMLHEIGHAFTYCEFLGTTLTTNYVIQHVARSLTETREVKRKYQILEETTDLLGIEVEDPELLVRSDKQTVIQTVLLRQYAVASYSELDSQGHDLTGWEMLADQFANRHGAGRALVTAMDKISRHGGREYRSKLAFWSTELIKSLLIILTLPITLLITNFHILKINTNHGIYDEPIERYNRIRRDLVDALKSDSLDKETRKRYLDDVEVIDDIVSKLNSNQTFVQFMHAHFSTRGRKEFQQMRFQQDLERLMNNDLFVKSSKLDMLTG